MTEIPQARFRRKLRRAAVGLALATLIGVARAAPPLTAAELTARGLDHFYNLEYDAALEDFHAAQALEPASAAVENHIAEVLLYREMYRVGALESELYGNGDPFLEAKLLPNDPAAIQAFLNANQQAIQLAQAAIGRNSCDAHAHYDLGAAWAMRGTLDFTLRHGYWDALGDAKTARSEALKATQCDASFLDPQLILGTHDYVAGSLPWAVRMFSSLIGYSGNKERGRATLVSLAERDPNARTDAETLLAVMDRRDGLNDKAAELLRQLSTAYPRNTVLAVEAGEALEAAGEHDAARTQYQSVLTRAAAGAPGFAHAPLDKVWYDLGNLERVYSHGPQAVADYDHAEAAPGAQPRYIQVAALAAGQVLLGEDQTAAAQAELEHCISLGSDTPAGRKASELLHP